MRRNTGLEKFLSKISWTWLIVAFRLHWASHMSSRRNLNADIISKMVRGLKQKGHGTERGAKPAIMDSRRSEVRREWNDYDWYQEAYCRERRQEQRHGEKQEQSKLRWSQLQFLELFQFPGSLCSNHDARHVDLAVKSLLLQVCHFAFCTAKTRHYFYID